MTVRKAASPLLGYNHNIRHRGRIFHVQTEDSGLKHPHVITHLFADGGRIVATKKTSYAEHLGSEDWPEVVRRLMQEQHKAMVIALRDGQFDEQIGEGELSLPITVDVETVDVDELERAAARLTSSGDTPGVGAGGARKSHGQYDTTRAALSSAPGGLVTNASVFGSDLVSDRSLDEVILSYLAEDLEEPRE
ncbi:MAG: hypothetical protein NZ898_09075 [Myxococcota bacterium]|nr:hypothetical protein [Myxococcota bacterium]MDW8363315.1 hypothetical protein [Myxococcales bacterium]